MITKLENFTCKSFAAYTNPTELLFRKRNILFGYNGNGKSSSAIGIKEQFLKDSTKKLENCRVFDRDYISNSLLLENSDEKIKGIEVSFGKGSVEIETQIKELQEQIISDTDIDGIEFEIQKLRKGIRKDIDVIHDRRKGGANIQKKSKDVAVEKVIDLYKKDLVDARKIESDDDELIKMNGDDSLEKQISLLESLRGLSCPLPSLDLIEDAKVFFKEKYGDDIEIPGHEVVQWIESGLHMHEEGDDCKFCNGKLDFSAVELKLSQFKANKRHKATDGLKRFNDSLKTVLASIDKIEKESKAYITNVGVIVEESFNQIVSIKPLLTELIDKCQVKIGDIESEDYFDFEALNVIMKTVSDSVAEIDRVKANKLRELRRKQNSLTSLVKGAIGLEIIKTKSIQEKLNEVETKSKELKEKRDSNKVKQRKIQALKQKKSLTKDFADFVTEILRDINISLKVTLDGDNRNYIIKSTNDEVVLAIKAISEGEKNLLALLFFYYELFSDKKQQQVKAEIELIVVDDPISSMDDSNKFYILELMKNLLEVPNQQVFILTHSWDDYCNLSYGKKAWGTDSNFATFEVRKKNGKSEFSKLSNVEKPYKFMFREIFAFSQKQGEEVESECQIYHYPNVMRRVFEEWYGFKIGKDLNLTSAVQSRLEQDLKIKSNNAKTRLGLLLKVCNILSHSINGSKNPQEIHRAAKYLMRIIEDNDPLHFNNMKE